MADLGGIVLQSPEGIPYPQHVRGNVITLYQHGWCPEEIARFFHYRPTISTVYRYIAEYEADPEHRVPRPVQQSNGPSPKLSKGEAYVLWIAKNCMRTLSGRNCVSFLATATGTSVSRSTISKELVHRLGMSMQ